MSSSSSTIPGIIVAVVIAGIMVFAYLNKDNSSATESAEHAGNSAEHAGQSAEHAGHEADSSDDEHAGFSGSVQDYMKKFGN